MALEALLELVDAREAIEPSLFGEAIEPVAFDAGDGALQRAGGASSSSKRKIAGPGAIGSS